MQERQKMKQSRFTETQILNILKSVESGRTVKDVCREHAISESSYFNWKAKYGGMQVSDMKRLRDLEAENAKLKRMYADMALENLALKDVIEKKL
jgi:putative transposase